MPAYISKGRIEALNKCRRKYYYNYVYKGGWDRPSPSIELAIGIAVHKGMEFCLLQKFDEAGPITLTTFDEYTKDWPEDDPLLVSLKAEGRDLALGLVLGWQRAKSEEFFSKYEVLSVEREIELPLTADLVLVARADATVRELASGLAYVWNWKTTSERKDWNSKWLYDIQMWTEAMALECSLGETVGGTIVAGLYKGTKQEDRLASQLLYSYSKNGAITPDYKAGWQRERVIDIAGWVEAMPIDNLRALYLESQPILKNDEVVEKWLRQIVRIESDVIHIGGTESEDDRLDYFTQAFSTFNCRGCPFLDVCMQRSSMEALIESGRLTPRTSPLDARNKPEGGIDND